MSEPKEEFPASETPEELAEPVLVDLVDDELADGFLEAVLDLADADDAERFAVAARDDLFCEEVRLG